MSKAWKKLDLGGAGLQSMNALLTREMRRRGPAYALTVLFPLGLHRFYLREPRGGLGYLALGLTGLALLLTKHAAWALAPLGAAGIWLAFDLFVWIERRIVTYNKALRVQHFLRPGVKPPRNYRGRYSDESELDNYIKEKERERAGHQPSDAASAASGETDKKRVPSFADQEAMLRELARARRGSDET
jgi:TM2 domain-containing membrane protein YozV